MNAERTKRAVEAALANDGRLGTVDVEMGASPVYAEGCVVVYLTDEREDGPHVIVQDAAGGGFSVGAYFEDAERMDDPIASPGVTAAAATAARLVGELSGLTG